MLTEELIQTVVREVLRRLQDPVPEVCVLVLAERDSATEEKVRALLAPFYGAAPALVFSGECCAGRAPERVILPFLSCSDMADLAAGRASGAHAAEALAHMLRGGKVEVLEFEYRGFAQTAPTSLYKLYASYENTLKSYGLTQFQPKRPENFKVHSALITAADVEKAAGEGARTMDAPAGAIITPLAAETADALGVSIRKQG